METLNQSSTGRIARLLFDCGMIGREELEIVRGMIRDRSRNANMADSKEKQALLSEVNDIRRRS